MSFPKCAKWFSRDAKTKMASRPFMTALRRAPPIQHVAHDRLLDRVVPASSAALAAALGGGGVFFVADAGAGAATALVFLGGGAAAPPSSPLRRRTRSTSAGQSVERATPSALHAPSWSHGAHT